MKQITPKKIDKNELKSLEKTILRNIASKVLSNSLAGKSGVRGYKLKSRNKKNRKTKKIRKKRKIKTPIKSKFRVKKNKKNKKKYTKYSIFSKL